MLFGTTTASPLAGQLLDAAAESGITFFDTAEMYPVPQSAVTHGASEAILGEWLQHQRREDFTVATKVAGPSGQMDWIRGGPQSLNASNIMQAIDGSLSRLQTDYIDLFQIHWPDRYVPMFGETSYDPRLHFTAIPLEEQLTALGQAVEAGKIRAVGLSNETPWGLMHSCQLAQVSESIPRIAAVQNAYSLVCRSFEEGLAECCHREEVSLLAYSPLAMGLLTGKYLAADGGPPEARLNRYKGRYAEAESRYGPRPSLQRAVSAYAALAQETGIAPVELAIRFVLSQSLVASAIVGATSLAQLQQITHAAQNGPLESALLNAINELHQAHPNPAP
ncbi:hypothetical protein WJX84_005029 [Apatococcus fuscideae]|uniref:NADP-dependent oxidoreductase domain-containing protein n=1 Tax=Apatococcus fuscideae TaxID=2026836 RepID=A0AAW1SRE3_9CHLO